MTATRLLITNATVMGHDLRLGGQELEAFNATVSWGDSGLQLGATHVNVRALQVIGDHEPFDGKLVLEGVTLLELAVGGGEAHVGHTGPSARRIARRLAQHR